jgi:tetratricopeptide (TPR) repeat protein
MTNDNSENTLKAIDGGRQKRSGRTIAKAVSLHLEGNREGAADVLCKAIDQGEQDPALFSALGHIYYEKGDHQSAARVYRQLTEIEPAHRTAHFNLAVCLGNLKQFGAAAESFRAAIKADAARADAALGLGISLLHAGNAADALEPLEEYLLLFPDREQALFAKAAALQQTGRTAASVEMYRKTLARNPKNTDALSNLVSIFLDKKDSESVKRYSEMLLELQPDAPMAMEALAALAFAADDAPAAAQQCRNLAGVAPDQFENWCNLGVAYHRMGDHGKAAEAYKKACTLNPSAARASLNLGVVHQEMGDLPAARACYERALECDPNQTAASWNLALTLEQLGERNWAEKLYARIPETAPEWCDACFRVGYLQLLRGDYAASAANFEACIAKRPEWPEAYLNAGIAYARAGDGESARRALLEALMIRPDSTEAARGLAALALEQQDYPQAFEMHQKLIEMGDHSPELFFNAGLICQKRGQLDDAATLYRQALAENAGFAEALLNLGHTLMAIGQEDEARSCWRRALREKPEMAQSYFEPSA